MKSLSLQGEFIKQYCVSLLGAVYFGVAGPGGKGRRNPSNLPFLAGPQNVERKREKGGEGTEMSCTFSAGGWQRNAGSGVGGAGGRALVWLQWCSSFCSSPRRLSQTCLRAQTKRAAGSSEEDADVS